MYTIQKAAAILGRTQRTVRRWIKQCGIDGKLIETDGRRVYLSYNDMLTLVGQYDRKTAKSDGKKKIQRENLDIMKNDKDDKYQENDKESMYTLHDTSLILGISLTALRKWILQHNINKKIIGTDRRRVYISHGDVLLLADLHNRQIANGDHADLTMTIENSNSQDNKKNKLCSLAEAASYLKRSKATVSMWISQHNIEKKTIRTDNRRVYIARDDVRLLADLHKRKGVPNTYPINIAGDLKEIRSQITALASDIEDIKHDMIVYVSKAIYVR
jgi:hypothetical protein